MTDTETLTDEQALQLEEQEREAEQASTETAPEQPEADGADTPETEAESDQGEGKDDRKVPLAALHEEREKRKALQQELQKHTQKLDDFEKRWATLQERLADGKEDKPKEPSFEDAPLDHLKMRTDQFAEFQRRQSEMQQMAAAQAQIAQQVGGYEAQFKQANPDYFDAVAHAKAARVQDHMLYGITEDRARQIVDQEAARLAMVAMQQGKDPASAFYDYAKSRGYQKAAPAAASGASVTDINKIREQTKSLGAGGGRTAPTKYTFEQIANMDVNDPRFDEALESLRAVQK